MDWHEIPASIQTLLDAFMLYSQKMPGAAIVARYIRSSYQDDPIRSLIELFLFLFAVRYLLAPSYSMRKQKGFAKLTEDEVDELVEDWQPEPLVASLTPFEEADLEKRPVIIGCVGVLLSKIYWQS